jgi:hypothetical protein
MAHGADAIFHLSLGTTCQWLGGVMSSMGMPPQMSPFGSIAAALAEDEQGLWATLMFTEGGFRGSLLVPSPDIAAMVQAIQGFAQGPAMVTPGTTQGPSVGLGQANFAEAENRARFHRVRTDMRTMAVVIEAYHVDWNRYPPSVPAGDPRNVNASHPLMSQRPGLAMTVSGVSITTPVAYMSSLPTDPFVPTGITHAYATLDESRSLHSLFGRWVLLSPGPDGDWDIDLDRNSPEEIPALIYDPQTGLAGSGDIVRGAQGFVE